MSRSHGWRRGLFGALDVVLVLAVTAASAEAATTTYTLDSRISQGDGGHPGNGGNPSTSFGVSDDGQVVAFETTDPLVTADTDSTMDLYVRDGATTKLLTSGIQPGSPADVHVLPDGDVLFKTADTIGPDADGSFDDYFLYKRGGDLKEISGPTATGNALTGAVISADGSMIAFSSTENLAGESDAGDLDVYAWSTAPGTSAPTLVTAGSGHSGNVGGISRDGSKIFYASRQPLPTDDGNLNDVFVGTPGGAAPLNVSDFAPAAGAPDDMIYAGSSPDGNTVAFETAASLDAGDSDASAKDLYENSSGTLEWLTKPGPAALGGDPTFELAPAVCDGGAAIMTTVERLASADTGVGSDAYRHPAGSGAVAQLLTGGGPGDARFIKASSDCNRVAVGSPDSLGGLGGGDPTIDDAFLVTGTTPSLIAFDATSPFVAGADLNSLIFQSKSALVAADGDSLLDAYRWHASDGSLDLITAMPGSGRHTVRYSTPDAAFVIDEATDQLGDGDSDDQQDVFRLRAREPLTITAAGNGSGTVESSPAGIGCGATCSALFDHATSVTLTATPASGSVFSGWSGACSGTADCTLTLDGPRDVTATFDAIPTGPGGGDTTPPTQALGGKKKQDVDKLSVTDTVSEGAAVHAQATVSLPAHKKSIKSKAVTAQVAAGHTQKLRLKFKKSALRKLKHALAGGKHLKATVTVTATDAAGNKAPASVKVKLKD